MFFKSLFDFKFENFVTRQVASVLYVASIAILAIAALVAFVFCMFFAIQFVSYSPSVAIIYTLVALLGVPVVSFLYLVVMRVAFESSVALVTIAENTGRSQMKPYSAAPAPSELTNLDVQTLLEDYENNPEEFARTMFDQNEFAKWVRAGRPDLQIWIRTGMPTFEVWLKSRV